MAKPKIAIAENSGRKIFRCQSVEIPTKANNIQQINIPDIQNLRDVNVWGIEFYVGDKDDFKQLQNAPSGAEIYSSGAMKNAFVNFEDYNGYVFINQCPVGDLVNFFYAGSGYPVKWEFTGQKINWNKSFVFLNDATLANKDKVFFMNVYYTLDIDTEIKDREANLNNKR